MKSLIAILEVAVVFGLVTAVPSLARTKTASRNNRDTLALVNGSPITASEFKKRFELAIYPHKEIEATLDSTKEGFLFSMISERLLADEAAKEGKTLTEEARQSEYEATNTYLRDALYREEILSKVHVTAKEIAEGVRDATYKYLIDVYYFSDSASAYEFYRHCLRLESVQLDSFVTNNRVPMDTMSVKYGDLVDNEEEAFWGHKKGFMSKPISGKDQFAIIRVATREYDVSFSHLSLQEKEEKIRKLFQKRKEIAATERYIDNTLGNVQVQMRKDMIGTLVDSISWLLNRQSPPQFVLYYNLTQPDIDTLLEMFRASDSSNMITIHYMDGSETDRTLNISEVINALIPSTFYCKDPSRPAVFSGIDVTLRHLVEYYLLAEKAVKMGLEKSTEVRSNVDLVMRAYDAAEMRDEVLDTVQLSASDLDEFLRKYNASDLKNIFLSIQKFNARTLDEAVQVYNLLDKLDSADSNTRRGELSRLNPDTVRSDAFLLGTVGSFFSQMGPGSIYGPIENREGAYSLYRLLSRTTNIPYTSLDLSIDTTKMIALSNKREEVLSRYVASLAEKGNVKIFLDALKHVRVEPIQMFTVRYVGFGGEINAVPGLPVCEGWAKLTPMKEIIIP